MSRWFRSLQFVDEFAHALAEEVDLVFPRDSALEPKPKAASRHRQRVEHGIATLQRRLQEFHGRERLTFFQKARLSHRLQDELLARGHPAERVRALALQVVTSI